MVVEGGSIWYGITGDLTSGRTPLLVIHGTSVDEITASRHGSFSQNTKKMVFDGYDLKVHACGKRRSAIVTNQLQPAGITSSLNS